MPMPSETAKPDLSSLRIDRTQRDAGKGGKRWGIVVVVLVVVALIAGAAWALRDQKPVVEVAVAEEEPAPTKRKRATGTGTRTRTPRKKAAAPTEE